MFLLPTDVSFSQLAYLEGNVGREKGSCHSPRDPGLGSRRRLQKSSSGLVRPCSTVTRDEHDQTNVSGPLARSSPSRGPPDAPRDVPALLDISLVSQDPRLE